MRKDRVTEKIDKVLEILPDDDVEIVEGELITVKHDENRSNDVEEDYKKRREVLYDLIKKGSDALDGILKVADASDHPRSYEVAGQLIKTMSDVSKDLTDLQQSMDKREGVDENSGSKNVTNNAIFVGSTTELLKTLKNEI